MKFSTKTRYGMRFMVSLGAKANVDPVQLSDIAGEEDISEKYLSQIVIPLKSSGLVSSERGANGGYRLAKDAKDISARDIVEIFEGSLYPVDCLNDPANCDRGSNCVTQKIWQKVGETLRVTLESISLQSLIDDYRQQKQVIDYFI